MTLTSSIADKRLSKIAFLRAKGISNWPTEFPQFLLLLVFSNVCNCGLDSLECSQYLLLKFAQLKRNLINQAHLLLRVSGRISWLIRSKLYSDIFKKFAQAFICLRAV